MPALLLAAALLPGLYWDASLDTAAALRQAGIQRIYVPAAQVKAWRARGFQAAPFDRAAARAAVAPSMDARMGVASATRQPWLNTNAGQFIRHPAVTYFYDAPSGAAALAAAEAFAYGVEAAIRAAPEDLPALAGMLHFLRRIERPRLPAVANIGVIDDGSPQLGEALNLMARHNLLFQIIRAPNPKYDAIVRNVADATDVRQRIGDEKRRLRIFGSSVVLGSLTAGGKHARLHLLNYGGATVRGLRVRLRGAFTKPVLAAFGIDKPQVRDYAVDATGVEFTISEMKTYAVVDLTAP